MIRFGEATNPGPSVHFEADHFTVGAFNPSGLRNKAQYFQTHLSYGDLWLVTETHFYGKDVSRFRAGLSAAKSAHRYCLTDRTSVGRSLTSQSSWKGVGILSKHPTRALPNNMPTHVQDSGRSLLFTTLFGDVWISGGAIYGEPNSSHYPSYLKNNEMQLHHVASHVCHLCTGPRVVGGDWNVTQDCLPAFAMLVNAGFRDIQDVALERWGVPLQATCKSRTRKDFLYLSPELQELLFATDVCHDVWPDHSVLVGSFHAPKFAPDMHVWPMPEQIPWPQQFSCDISWPAEPGDMTLAYAEVWKKLEASAQDQCPFPVSHRMMGRAKRLTPKRVRGGLFAPVKLARKGDFQPTFFGSSVKHSQWLRQVRRLQSYARMAGSSATQLGVTRAELWGAIVRAKGFHHSFSLWWSESCFKTWDAPITCPVCPPDADIAGAMFESLSMAVRDLECTLRASSRQYAKYRRAQNPNLVFQDIRPPAVPGVDVLLQPIRAVVEDVDVGEQKIVLDRACDFHPEGVISCKGQPIDVVCHSEDAIWVSDTTHVSIGDTISQTKFVGKHEDLAAAFVGAWKERWMRHADVAPERWNEIVSFARRFLPPLQLQWPSMTVHDFRMILRRKKKTTSPGFDGVTLLDLQRMPDNVLQVFCDMFISSEHSGKWPAQLIDGRVISLAKVACPATPADFRPITIFGLLYRVWSSYHSQKSLSLLDAALPDTLYGGRPGRYAAQVWSKLLWSIEYSFQHSVELTGLVADLQKAFNMLPRLVVFEVAGHLGLPSPMLLAWAGALTQMKRRFLLRGSLTDGVSSVTGFPEGCGLSCVAMVLIDYVFHAWQQHFFPLCTALSYVDDWQLLCPHSSMMSHAKACLDRFVAAVDLQLDAKKTYAWSITNEGRRTLREAGFTVVLASKNLGAHAQFSKKHLNASLVDRVQSMSSLWSRLRLSASSYRNKVRALLVAAWPKALHAVAATAVGDGMLHTLRTGAMKGLSADGAGSNAWLQLGLVEHPMADPGFWAIIQTIRGARDCGDPVQIGEALRTLTTIPDKIPANCISNTLLSRVQMLGWHFAEDGLIQDEFGRFSLFEASIFEVTFRAQWAWQKLVSTQVAHRPGFKNLHQADVGDTRMFLRTLPAEEQELFHKCLNTLHRTVKPIAKKRVRRFAHFVDALTPDFTDFGCVSILPLKGLMSLLMSGA